MSHINHDTAARLLGLAPGDLEALVKQGAVRRADRNAYVLPVLLQDYIGHLKSERDRAELAPKQADIAQHLDVSERSVREFLDDAGIDHKLSTLSDIRVAYIRRLREVAAGRAAEGGLDLATERARLAREQADKVALQNAQTRRELAPVVLMEETLARTAGRVRSILATIKGEMRRRFPQIASSDLAAVDVIIARAQNACAALTLETLDEQSADDDAEVLDAEVAE